MRVTLYSISFPIDTSKENFQLDEHVMVFKYRVCQPAANSQSIIRDDIEIGNQLKNAKATEIWYFWHSSPKWQCPRSLKYKTVMPAEEEAAASDSVAVTCTKQSRRLLNERS